MEDSRHSVVSFLAWYCLNRVLATKVSAGLTSARVAGEPPVSFRSTAFELESVLGGAAELAGQHLGGAGCFSDDASRLARVQAVLRAIPPAVLRICIILRWF